MPQRQPGTLQGIWFLHDSAFASPPTSLVHTTSHLAASNHSFSVPQTRQAMFLFVDIFFLLLPENHSITGTLSSFSSHMWRQVLPDHRLTYILYHFSFIYFTAPKITHTYFLKILLGHCLSLLLELFHALQQPLAPCGY